MTSTFDFARRLLELETQVSSKAPQLAYSTIEAGALTSVDEFDTPKALIGQQFDGAHIAMPVSGITPLTPTAPVLEGAPGALKVRWDGLWVDGDVVPSDFSRVEIHIQLDTPPVGDVATTLYGTFETPRGGEQSFTLPPGTYYAVLVARNASGQRGPASGEGHADVEAVVSDADLAAIDQAVTDAQQAATDAQDAVAGVPDQVAAAKAEAISTAASDAATKAGQAKADAIAAAIDDATAKYDNARVRVGDWTVTGKTTIDGGKLEADSVVAAKIAADAILARNIKAGEVVAGKLAAGAVIAGTIAANAVTASNVASNSISARHLVVADMSNMAEINELVPGSVTYGGWTHVLETVGGVVWSKRSDFSSNPYVMFRNQVGPVPLKAGDRVRVTFEAFADAAVNATGQIWAYGATNPPSWILRDPATALSTVALTTVPTTYALEADITSAFPEAPTAFLIGLSGLTGRDVRVRNVRAYRMGAGELVVDGGIVAGKIAANAVTATTIAGDAVTAVKLAADAVLARNIKAGEVTAGKLAALAVVAGNIDANAVTAGNLAAGAVVAGNIAANAVTSSTIAAGAITARELLVADTSNMAEVNEYGPTGVTYTEGGFGTWTHAIQKDAGNIIWSRRDNPSANQYFMFRRQTGPMPFKNGDRIRVTFEAYSDATVNASCRLWTYGASGNPSLGLAAVAGFPTQFTTSVQSFAFEGTPTGMTDQTSFLIGLNGLLGRDVRVRNVRARVMNAGELIVQGSITTNLLAADAITGMLITGSTLQTATSGQRMKMRPGASASVGVGNGVLEMFTGNNLEGWPAEIFPIADGPLVADNISLYIAGPEKTGYAGARPFTQLFAKDSNSPSQIYSYAEYNVMRSAFQSSIERNTGAAGSPTDYVAVANNLVSFRTASADRMSLTSTRLSASVDIGTSGEISANSQLYTYFTSTGNFTSPAGAYTGAHVNLTSGTFVAPSSGRIRVIIGGFTRSLTNDTRTACGYELRTGGTVRSGTLVQGYSGFNAIANYNSSWVVGERSSYVGGLTPGATYNVAAFLSSDSGGGASSISILVEALL